MSRWPPMADEKALPTLAVQLKAGYHLHSIRRIVRDLRPIYALTQPTVVTLDLTSLTFIGPACLAFMVAVMRRGREKRMIANGSVILKPNSVGVQTYLHRMDALRVLFEKEPHKPEDPVIRHDATGLKECEHFSTQEGGRRIAESLASAMQEVVKTDDVARASLKLALLELTENVPFHAATRHGGFAAAQTFKNGQEIEVAIVDLGVGIAESLRQNPEHAAKAGNDISAIRAAIRPLVTATPDRNNGYGLAFTRFLLEGNDGRLIVWSGEGWVQFGENPAEKTMDPIPGTLVALRLHTDRPFDFKRAFSKLTVAIFEAQRKIHDNVREPDNAPS